MTALKMRGNIPPRVWRKPFPAMMPEGRSCKATWLKLVRGLKRSGVCAELSSERRSYVLR